MAPASLSNTGMAAANEPPPSTLAAIQLADISVASVEASRSSDDSSEMKRLFGVITRVKDNPDLLKTFQDRLVHNHMLIYVYARVVLGGIRLNDLFLDPVHLRTEALKALNFFRVSMAETPAVLLFAPERPELQYRGSAPLWLWLFPKILKLLGHDRALDIGPAIESFFRAMMLFVVQHSSLWVLAPAISQYFRGLSNSILDHLRDNRTADSGLFLGLELPQHESGDQVLEDSAITYRLSSLSHTMRHISSLLSILAHPIACNAAIFLSFPPLHENLPWLFDALLDLNAVQERWHEAVAVNKTSLLRLCLDLLRGCHAVDTIQPFTRKKGFTVLALLCTDLTSSSSELDLPAAEGTASNLEMYCNALLELTQAVLTGRAIRGIVASKTLDSLDKLSAQSPHFGDGTDGYRCVQLLKTAATGGSGGKLPGVDLLAGSFQGQFLRDQFALLRCRWDRPDGERPVKRRRTISESVSMTQLTCRLNEVLGVKTGQESASFEETFLEKTTTVDSRPDCENKSAKKEAEIIFGKILAESSLVQSTRLRVLAMVALRRLVCHTLDLNLLNLETSGPGQRCLQSLSSSVRELRIAGGRALALFMKDDKTSGEIAEIARRNRKNAIGFLKSISEKSSPLLDESCTLAWGQLGRYDSVVNNDELNLVLIKMLEYLGNSNNLVSSFAFNEVLILADSRRTTPRRLFEPFWRSLAYMATKDMVSRPQMIRSVSELLQISVNELLLLVQTHALPWLVLDRKKEVIQKIAEARQENDIWRPLMDPANLGAVLSVLLVQPVGDIEAYVTSRFNEMSDHPLSLVELLRLEPALTAMELLKAAGEADEARKPHCDDKIRNSLSVMSRVLLQASKEKYKKGHVIGRFLQPHVLNLMARLTDVFNEPALSNPPVLEQRRCINAMEEMIKVAKAYARIARPQISACLLSTFSVDELRPAAFSCWAAMITHLDYEDVEVLIETTFFIVSRYWSSFDDATVQQAKTVFHFLLEKYNSILTENIDKLPSLIHIPALSDFEAKLSLLRKPQDSTTALGIFAARLSHENSGVVHQALTELAGYLKRDDDYLHTTASHEQPDPILSNLMRSLLDCVAKYGMAQPEIGRLCAECIGMCGCLDSNRIENVRDHRNFVLLNNIETTDETTDFALFILEEVLVKSFLSTTDTKLQGFLSFAMQELLERCNVKAACGMQSAGLDQGSHIYRKWIALPESVREVLTPFLSSGYRVAPMAYNAIVYPLFRSGKPYGNWLRSFTLDLLHKTQNPFADIILEPLCRLIRVKDLFVADFLLPYLVMHLVLGNRSGESERENVVGELLAILRYEPPAEASYIEREEMKRFYQAVFRVLDYAMRWVQAKNGISTNLSPVDESLVRRVQGVLKSIPAELISQRAVDCQQYARALFHLEQHAQKVQSSGTRDERERILCRIQDIYQHIDEPDGLEGLSAHMQTFDINQQILGHQKAGRWIAAKTWYEIQIAEQPDNTSVQIDLLNCLKKSGQYDVLLSYVEGMQTAGGGVDNKIMPLAAEAAWSTGRWDRLQQYCSRFRGNKFEDFNISIATVLSQLHTGGGGSGNGSASASGGTAVGSAFDETVGKIWEKLAGSMTVPATASLQACHELRLKCHVLTDLEIIVRARQAGSTGDDDGVLSVLSRRLEILGAYVHDKQYVLGVRRAAMELSKPKFSNLEISSLWLSSARLARKANLFPQSFNAILHASKLGDDSATIENARLLWKEGHHRKAIQVLQGAIDSNAFTNPNQASTTHAGAASKGGTTPSTSTNKGADKQQRLMTAQAQLLLAKWLDAAGQTHMSALREKYQNPPKTHASWEKGHYYLGRHYKKVLESEQSLRSEEQSDACISGQLSRVVIENYMRSLNCGTKYLYQTLPRVLTLWLELGAKVDQAPEGRTTVSRELHRRRTEQLNVLHTFLDRYTARLPAYILYTALPQIVARITHPHPPVFERLSQMIIKVVEAHPRQALWSLFGIMTSKQASAERRTRGQAIIQALRVKSGELKSLLRASEKLAGQLLSACQHGKFPNNRSYPASLTRDLQFNHSCTPCPLVVPVERYLTATLPALTEQVKRHRAFAGDVVTIECFLDEVLVLGSLAKPRRLTARGSDGRSYMLLIKPKDDLRTDQRLMEFNGMINRSLKREAECSRRQLYIRTYAVTPLNEACGIIEWVDGLKTLREVLLALYHQRGLAPDYEQIKLLLREAMPDSGGGGGRIEAFTHTVLGMFPVVLAEWFVHGFPDASAWFAARLKFTRSTAVMSMVGTILGLGDRHGENLLVEEGNGGILHVDFNCLFDKGLTFQQPERVPFRLTHNMVAAMGIYGYEGPFRHCCVLTLRILRQQEETLMTILEAFIYDPTLELQREKPRGGGGAAAAAGHAGEAKGAGAGAGEAARMAPRAVVESIRRKVRGLLPSESIPLSVEGQVDELIKQAVDPRNLTSMYIGWCPFL